MTRWKIKKNKMI